MRFTIQPKYYDSAKRKRTSLLVQASIKGKVLKKSTGLTIPTAAWDIENKKLKKSCPGWSPAEQLKAQRDLSKLEQVLNQRALQISADEGRDMNADEFTETLAAFVAGARDANRTKVGESEQPNLIEYLEEFIPSATKRRNKHARNDGERITETTVQQYTQLLPVLVHFKNWTDLSMDLRKIDVSWHDAFLEWGADVEMLGPATLGKHIKSLKRLFYYAQKDGLEVNPAPLSNEDFDKPRQPKNDVQYLTREELEKIKALDLKGKPALNLERDRLLIGCWTGLRVSDLGRLNMKMLLKSNKDYSYIKLLTQKTRKKVAIPVLKDVQEVLDRRGEFPRFRTEQSFNAGIKELCRLAGINEVIEAEKQGTLIVERKNENGKKYKEEVKRKIAGKFEKWELLSTHSCRRSFASNFYGFFPNQVIMGITGHSKEEDFLRYVGVTEEQNADTFMELYLDKMRQNGLL